MNRASHHFIFCLFVHIIQFELREYLIIFDFDAFKRCARALYQSNIKHLCSDFLLNRSNELFTICFFFLRHNQLIGAICWKFFSHKIKTKFNIYKGKEEFANLAELNWKWVILNNNPNIYQQDCGENKHIQLNTVQYPLRKNTTSFEYQW